MQIKCQCFDGTLAGVQSEMIQFPFFSSLALRPIAPHSQLGPRKMGSHSGAFSALLIILLCFVMHLHARLEQSLIHDIAHK